MGPADACGILMRTGVLESESWAQGYSILIFLADFKLQAPSRSGARATSRSSSGQVTFAEYLGIYLHVLQADTKAIPG